jgi:beta-glucanase (GH16 family)
MKSVTFPKKQIFLIALMAAFGGKNLCVSAQEPGVTVASGTNNEASIKRWTLEGPLGAGPKRLTENLPLSDQRNLGSWRKFEAMSDEFDGDALDTNKWVLGISGWQGRQPAWFNPANVTVSGGQLRLTMRKEVVPQELANQGYHDYSSAALHTRARSSYGYYEVKARPMHSSGSSAFWFTNEDPKTDPEWGTEIDVFELCGLNPQHDRRYYMTLHVWQTPQEKRHWSVGAYWEAPTPFAEAFHVFGFEWKRKELRWYLDGVLVHTVQNTHWHQPLFLIFDSETMPEWFGMPHDGDLPSTFSVEYVRAWRGKDE